MTTREYSDEIRAAVMAALLAGQSVSSVAKEYSMPKGTVSGWKRQTARVAENATQKAEIGNKLLVYLNTALETLTTQVKFFGDETWLRKQPAQEIAVLHGIVTDKAIRLLEALADDSGQDEEG